MRVISRERLRFRAGAGLLGSSRGGEGDLELIRATPLRIIRTEDEFERAIATVDRLSDRGTSRTPDETEYVLALSEFVEKYEQEHHPIPPGSGVDMLGYLIETH